MLLDEFAELGSIALCLACPDSRDVLEFLFVDGIEGGHGLEGCVLEDDIGGHVVFLGYLLAKVKEHAVEHLVCHASAALIGGVVEVAVEVVVLDHHERCRLLDELLACLGEFEGAVGFDFLVDVAIEAGLDEDGIPHGVLDVSTCTELLEFVEVVVLGVAVAAAHEDVDDVLGLEGLLHGHNGRPGGY